MLKKEEAIPWPGTLAIVHSYIAYKAGRKMGSIGFFGFFFSVLKLKNVIEGVIIITILPLQKETEEEELNH